MPQPELNSDPVDTRKQRRRGKTKGRVVDLNALLEVQNLLGDESRARDLLIEHLHLIQDHYGHQSAAHLRALAEEQATLDDIRQGLKDLDAGRGRPLEGVDADLRKKHNIPQDA